MRSTAASTVPGTLVASVLVGFPAAYLLNSVSPWARKFSLDRDDTYFFAFVASLLALHWLSVAASTWILRRGGLGLADIGLATSLRTGTLLMLLLLAVGAAVAALRTVLGPAEPLWQGPAAGLHLTSASQRGAWIVVSISAGFCEEFVYRGFGITLLRAHGIAAWLAVVLSTTAWVLVHGVGGVLFFVPHFLVGLLFAGLFLWWRRLAPIMFIHAMVDLSLLGT
jgi:membrane protease YdiL (CAAX protease family)